MPASAAPAPAAAERAFRRALGRFATGVTLITAPGGASLVVNAFMSVSLDPPLVAFSVGHSSLTWRRMRRSARLGINVLDSSVDDVRDRARPGADRLAGLEVRDAHGVPRLAQATAGPRARRGPGGRPTGRRPDARGRARRRRCCRAR